MALNPRSFSIFHYQFSTNMFYLLSLEWKKYRKNVIFLLLIAAYTILLPSALMLGKKMDQAPPPLDSNQVFFMFPTVWEYLGYIGNWFSFFFLGFFAVLMVTTEYANRTLRQNIITGLQRWEFLLGKLLFAAAISLGAAIYYAVCALVIGYFNTDYVIMSKVMQNAGLAPRFFLMSFGYMTFGLLLGMLIKRGGIALLAYFAYIMFLEPILRWGVHLYFFEHASMRYYPLNAIEDLVPAPFAPQADQFARQYDFSLFLNPTEATLLTLAYLALFILITFRYIARSDL